MQRRLAAILAADVVDYSRLMGEDQARALDALRQLRKELFEPLVSKHKGTVVKRMGDGWIVEFASVADAVDCAMRVHEGLAGHEVIRLRTGIHIGDVVFEEEDVFGDGVNVAARLEELAAPGEVLISDTAHQSLDGSAGALFNSGDRHQLKNIARAIQVWRWPAGSASDTAATMVAAKAGNSETLTLPDKPSIAVLPFQNMGGDPEQEYFADGMTEDIITELSQFRSLFVIARNSTFAYKGTSPDVRDVARDLGVRYILEGSVRRGGTRIRITGQLIDAETGNHIWADRYDRDLEDIFAVQDEVTEAIVAAIAPEISDVERKRSQRKPPDNFDAWGLYQRGLAAYYSSTGEGHRSAIELFDKANDVAPTFAPAFAMAGHARTRYVMHFMPDNRNEILDQAREKTQMAITLDPRDSMCMASDGRAHSVLGNHDVAIAKAEEAIALNANDANAHYLLSAVLCSAGRAEEAIPHVDHAMRLSPRDIFLTGMLFHRALMLFDLERYDEAFEWGQRASLSPYPRPLTFALLTVLLIKLGRDEEARAALGELLAQAPETTCAKFEGNPMFGGPEVLERFIDALRNAGLPEG